MSAFPFAIVYFLPLTILLGYQLGGWFNFLTPVTVFGLIPLVDLIFGINHNNPESSDFDRLKEIKAFRHMTWIAVLVQLALLFWGVEVITRGGQGIVASIGLTVSIGISGGAMGINISHELVHRHNKLERFLGLTLLWMVSYMHWAIEHVSGHHMNVATEKDPATAREGESFYRFFPRTVFGTLKSSWEIEQKRLARKKSNVGIFENRLVKYYSATALLALAFLYIWGPLGLIYIIAQSFAAFTLLEIVNYLEHYGLVRKKSDNGKYEKVKFHHSWNSGERITNWFLFNLQRHSDHHANPGNRYQLLRHIEQAPQLPTGYAGMVPLALIPPLWFRIMDKKLAEHKRVFLGNEPS